MLELKNISKIYHTSGFSQRALDKVSVAFRENEFVSILGQSGGGKTTLLNIIGGLMRYDEGDLIIDGKSTRDFTDKDWDYYRNVRIGFIFQSYNLISHQTVLENVKLSLTLSNKDGKDMEAKAIRALERVGLGDHINKKPAELSGGQMQRVAIARALVNDPQILLADEPTGALDSETSVQIMDLLKEIAKDRLVIMVTHNRQLAEDYSTRIIGLKDGKLVSDTDPYEAEDRGKSFEISKIALKLRTALGLSFNNLLSKKARTLLTAFAGSIGIIGIALIISISNGASDFIAENQRDTLKAYPINIERQAVDFSSMANPESEADEDLDEGKVYSNDIILKNRAEFEGASVENNLEDFKSYLEANDDKLEEAIGSHFISYSYEGGFDIFTKDPDGILVNTDGSDFEDDQSMGLTMNFSLAGASEDENPNFSQLITTKDGEISPMVTEEYELIGGKWPEKEDELILFTDSNNQVLRSKLYELGILKSDEYEEILAGLDEDKKVDIDKKEIDPDEIIGKVYRVLAPADYFEKTDQGFMSIKDDDKKVKDKIENAKTLKIVGVAKKTGDDENRVIQTPMAYTRDFTEAMVAYVNETEIVKSQLENKEVNVLNGLKFNAENDDEKVDLARNFLENLSEEEVFSVNAYLIQNKEDLVKEIQEESKKAAMANPSLARQNEETSNKQMVDYILNKNDRDLLIEIYDEFLRDKTYKKNLDLLGAIDKNNPAKISIYVENFENRDNLKGLIDSYNEGKAEKDKIKYTDFIGLISKSVTNIISAISYILIAFVGVSLIVSSIMIGIITYISVFERTKEIGILRAIGASKRDIYKVFMAETLIIGLLSGLIGVGITLLLNIPITNIMQSATGFDNIGSSLPAKAGIILVIISVVLSLIAGLIPSRLAAKKDPVEALSAD